MHSLLQRLAFFLLSLYLLSVADARPPHHARASPTLCGAISCDAGCSNLGNFGATLQCLCPTYPGSGTSTNCVYETTYGSEIGTNDGCMTYFPSAVCSNTRRRKARMVEREHVVERDTWQPESRDPSTINEDEMQPW